MHIVFSPIIHVAKHILIWGKVFNLRNSFHRCSAVTLWCHHLFSGKWGDWPHPLFTTSYITLAFFIYFFITQKTHMQVMSSCTLAILFPLSPVEAACYRGLCCYHWYFLHFFFMCLEACMRESSYGVFVQRRIQGWKWFLLGRFHYRIYWWTRNNWKRDCILLTWNVL